MKYLFIIMAMALCFNAFANTVNVDPNDEDLLLSCTYPIAREDGSALDIGEIAKVIVYVKDEGSEDSTYVFAGENLTACEVLVPTIDIPNGNYVYAFRTLDTGNRISNLSPETVTALVKRILPPNAQTGVTGTAIKR